MKVRAHEKQSFNKNAISNPDKFAAEETINKWGDCIYWSTCSPDLSSIPMVGAVSRDKDCFLGLFAVRFCLMYLYNF